MIFQSLPLVGKRGSVPTSEINFVDRRDRKSNTTHVGALVDENSTYFE